MPRKAEKIARRARLACEKWREHFKWNIDQYHAMHTFVLGQQWSDDEEEILKSFRKVPMVANQLAAMANTMMGEQQQNTPQLQVVPMDDCNEEVAHLRELIIKDITFSDRATTAYQVAAGQAFIGGYSAFAWDTEFATPKSFDLDFVCRHFKDATRTYFDVSAEHINKTDGMHAGFINRMSRPKFKDIYGADMETKISKVHGISQTQEEIALAVQPSEGDDPFTWADNEAITILDHFERKYIKEMIYKLSNGKILNQNEMDELIENSQKMQENQMLQNEQQMPGMGMPEDMAQTNPMGQNEAASELLPQPQMKAPQQMPDNMNLQGGETQAVQGESAFNPKDEAMGFDEDMMTLYDGDELVRIEDKREIKRYKIMHYKIAGDYILDEAEFPSDQLPIVFVDQNSYYDKNGKQMCRSFFGDVKDTQRYINYLRTQSAYIIKVSRYDQFIGSKKNVQGLDTQRNWRDPNATQGMLAYDESPNGHKPEQLRPPELSQSLITQYQLAIEDLYRCTGLYPSRLGEQGNEISGKAIDARTKQGSYSTYVAFNSINRAIATGGEIVNEMIPRVYDSQRVIALMTPDEGMKNITLNKQVDEYGIRIENDIRKGTYQVRLQPGPSYEGQKQEALMSLQQILQAKPESFDLIADLYAENLPLANTIEIKNRLKTLVPPQIIEAGKTGKMPEQNAQPSPEQQQLQLQAQMQQQEMQFRGQELQLKQQEIQLKQQEIAMEAQFKLQELETERLETAGKLKEQELRYMAETQRTQSDAQISHADNLVKILTHKVSQ